MTAGARGDTYTASIRKPRFRLQSRGRRRHWSADRRFPRTPTPFCQIVRATCGYRWADATANQSKNGSAPLGAQLTTRWPDFLGPRTIGQISNAWLDGVKQRHLGIALFATVRSAHVARVHSMPGTSCTSKARPDVPPSRICALQVKALIHQFQMPGHCAL